jgi:hypothetical protein
MQLISSRTIPVIDGVPLTTESREALFRDDRGNFILYLAGGDPASAREERIIRLRLREALIWLNEDRESWWE